MANGQAQAQQQPLIQGQPQLQVQVDPAVQAFLRAGYGIWLYQFLIIAYLLTFQSLRVEVANVTQALTAQGISSIVSRFDGNPKSFRECIKSIEQYAVLVNADEDRKKLIAYQSSGGAVSGFIQRYMEANVAHISAQIKAQLAVRFSDVTDNQIALSILRQVRQKAGEKIHNYAERILSLAEEAYENQGSNCLTLLLMGYWMIS